MVANCFSLLSPISRLIFDRHALPTDCLADRLFRVRSIWSRSSLDVSFGIEAINPFTVVLKASVWPDCGHRASTAETRSKKLASGAILNKESFSSSAATRWLAVGDAALLTAASIVAFRSFFVRTVGSGSPGSHNSIWPVYTWMPLGPPRDSENWHRLEAPQAGGTFFGGSMDTFESQHCT